MSFEGKADDVGDDVAVVELEGFGDGLAEEHVAAEGAEAAEAAEAGSEARSVKAMLFSTEPDPPLEEVESPWDPDLGGLTRVKRGVQKALGYDGVPAIFDLFVGAAEAVHAADLEGLNRGGESGGSGEKPPEEQTMSDWVE